MVTDQELTITPDSFELASYFTADNKPHFQAALKNKSIDTIIFAENSEHQKQTVQEMIFDASKMGKNIVIADRSFSYILPYSTAKKWSCDIEPTFYNLSECKIEIPLITIFDDNTERLIKTCQLFAAKFEANGYYAPICSNSPTGILINAFHLPGDILKTYSYLSQVQRAYSAELLICGIHTHKHTFHSYLKYFESLETDIAIFLSPETGLEYTGENSIHRTASGVIMKNNQNIETVICADKHEEVIFESTYNTLIN